MKEGIKRYIMILPAKLLRLNRCGWGILGLFVIALSLTGCSAYIEDSANMLINLSKTYPQIQKLITAGAYLVGIGLAMRAIYYLKIFGEMRTMMASQGNLKTPIIYLIVAVALIYLPQTIDDVMLSTFGNTEVSPISYNNTSVQGLTLQATNAILGFIQIIGLISFVRGWIIIAKSAQGAAQGASFGKGATHIVGGILAINIVGTKDAIWGTLGFS